MTGQLPHRMPQPIDVRHHGPADEQLLRRVRDALRAHTWNPDNSAFTGASVIDLESARNLTAETSHHE